MVDDFRKVDLTGVIGRLYLHSMPGRYEAMEEFSKQAAARQVDRVISLAGIEELHHKSPDYAALVEMGSTPWQQEVFPIPDFGVPEDPEAFRSLAQDAAAHLQGGENVLIHCGAGIGRTGTFAILVLKALGLDLPTARQRVRQAGSGPETEEQRALVEG